MFVLNNLHYKPDSQSAGLLSGSKHVAQDIVVCKIVCNTTVLFLFNLVGFNDAVLRESSVYVGTIILRNGAPFCTQTSTYGILLMPMITEFSCSACKQS
jgi:hypothetical protein